MELSIIEEDVAMVHELKRCFHATSHIKGRLTIFHGYRQEVREELGDSQV
jgi:hypothetical protein